MGNASVLHHIKGLCLVAAFSMFALSAQAAQDNVYPATTVQITDSIGNPVSIRYSSNSQVVDSMGEVLASTYDVTVTLAADAVNTLNINGTVVAPGESITFAHDFAATNGYLQFDHYPVAPAVEGTSDFASISIDVPAILRAELDISPDSKYIATATTGELLVAEWGSTNGYLNIYDFSAVSQSGPSYMVPHTSHRLSATIVNDASFNTFDIGDCNGDWCYINGGSIHAQTSSGTYLNSFRSGVYTGSPQYAGDVLNDGYPILRGKRYSGYLNSYFSSYASEPYISSKVFGNSSYTLTAGSGMCGIQKVDHALNSFVYLVGYSEGIASFDPNNCTQTGLLDVVSIGSNVYLITDALIELNESTGSYGKYQRNGTVVAGTFDSGHAYIASADSMLTMIDLSTKESTTYDPTQYASRIGSETIIDLAAYGDDLYLMTNSSVYLFHIPLFFADPMATGQLNEVSGTATITPINEAQDLDNLKTTYQWRENQSTVTINNSVALRAYRP
ncbi:MAG: hypothetical protein C9356_20250 [Oleiphilus sp.]|nr:MAG: hypothetical protein C9356_20250 [Oleiphilus sp.]